MPAIRAVMAALRMATSRKMKLIQVSICAHPTGQSQNNGNTYAIVPVCAGLRKIVELVWNPTESWTVWQDSGTAYVINFLLVPNLSLLIDTSLLSKSERPSLSC